MLKRFLLLLSYCAFLIVILLGMSLHGCTGSTTLEHPHHLLQADSLPIYTCFIRPKEGLLPSIEIKLDGEDLISLPEGSYSVLNLKSGKYDMVVTNHEFVRRDTQYVFEDVVRTFVLDLTISDSVYVLIAQEKVNFLGGMIQGLFDAVLNNSSLNGYGYEVKNMSRKKAVKIASKLEPVGSRKIR